MANSRLQVIRCDKNKYQTPLFSFDLRGIYVRCKDCRQVMDDGTIKRGVLHLYPWAVVMQMMLGLYVVEEKIDGRNSSNPEGDNSQSKSEHTDHVAVGSNGDTRRQLDEHGVPVPIG